MSLALLLPASLTLSAVGRPHLLCQIILWSQITVAEQLHLHLP